MLAALSYGASTRPQLAMFTLLPACCHAVDAEARPLQLSTGLTAYLVSIPAAEEYCKKSDARAGKAVASSARLTD